MSIFNQNNLIKINDVYYINKRIKHLNSDYQLFYNIKLNRYEIHDISKKYSFITSTQKYPTNQIINKLISMHSKSTSQILKEIDNHNDKIYKEQEKKLSLLHTDQLNEVFKFSNVKLNQNLSNFQIKKIIQS